MFSFAFIFLVLSFKPLLGIRKQVCSDYECTINAVITRAYPKFAAGMPGVEPVDPLHVASIVVEKSGAKYSLLNASLIGLKDCEFTKLNYEHSVEVTNFDYEMFCPVVTLSSDYEASGTIDSKPIGGKGSGTVVYNDLQILITGKHKKIKDDKGKLHIKVLDYSIKAVANGGASKIEYNNQLKDKKSVDDAKRLEEITREGVMDAFMHQFMSNYMKFHQHMSVEDLHFKYVA